jgi:hypothetical protein
MHVVCARIGSRERIGVKRYLQVTDDYFDRANGSAAKSDAVNPENAPQNPVQQTAALARATSPSEQKTPILSGFSLAGASARENLQDKPMTLTGFEPVSRP